MSYLQEKVTSQQNTGYNVMYHIVFSMGDLFCVTRWTKASYAGSGLPLFTITLLSVYLTTLSRQLICW